MFATHLLLCWGLLCDTPSVASPPVVGGSRPYNDWFLLNRSPPRTQPPRLLPLQRPLPVCAGGGIHDVDGVVIAGAKFSVCGGVYGFVAPRLSYMLVGTGGGAAHVGGALHDGLSTVGVVAMFAIYFACSLPLYAGPSSPVPCLKYFCSTHLCWRWMHG